MRTQHLSDCFMEAIAYVIFFLKTPSARQASYDQVKAGILRLLAQGDEGVKKGLFSQEDYEAGRFAVCAWIDEAILNSSWNQKTTLAAGAAAAVFLWNHGSGGGIL